MPANELEVTQTLATYVAQGTFEALPPPVVEIIKNSLLDGLAVALAGSLEPASRKILAFVQEQGGTARSSVIGSGIRTSPVNAALANGVLVHALDYDDGIQIFSFHATSVMLPTIFALGEAEGLSGKEAIASFAYGLETAAALFRSANRREYDLGWHRTSTVGTLASAAAASKVLGLDPDQTQMALGIGASQASGIRQNFGSMTKPLHSGLAARNGVMAALLAKSDFTSDAHSLEGKLGLCNVLFGAENYRPELIIESLTHPFDYISAIRIKKYPACGQNTRPIDAMLALIREYDIRPEDIEQVECGVSPTVMNTLFHSRPSTGLEGKFSLEFCLAAALIDRSVGLDHFTNERVRDPAVQRIIAKIGKYPDPSVPHSGGKGPTVTIRLINGRELSRRVDMPEGQPYMPASRAEQIAKYRDCAKRIIPEKQLEACLELMENLEQVDDIRRIMETVTVF